MALCPVSFSNKGAIFCMGAAKLAATATKTSAAWLAEHMAHAKKKVLKSLQVSIFLVMAVQLLLA
jgi:hypothetical protein